MHAILCRNWSIRPKGRDWYDLIWYISQGVPLDLRHLNARLQQNCSWLEKQDIKLDKEIDKIDLLRLLELRIKDLDVAMAKRDVEVFISDSRVLDIWSQEFFRVITKQILFEVK